MLLATFFFALMNLCVKFVKDISAIEIIFFRSIISLVISYAFLKKQKVNVFGNNKPILLLRGISGAIALTLFFITLQKIPLASAVTLQFFSPIFTTIIGIFMVKEKVKAWQWLFFAISFVGILIIQGFDPRLSIFYAGLGLGSALLSGVAYNCIRKLNTTEHPLVIVMYFPLVTVPLSLVYVIFNWDQPQGMDWVLLILIGILTQLAQFYMTKSYQSEELSKVANLKFLGILYALGFGYVFFEETFDDLLYLGMALVLLGVILNVIYKSRTSRSAAVSK